MTTVDAAPVTLDVDSDGIGGCAWNRPEASNGLNVELLKALHEAILRCHSETSVRVVLLSGAGRNFCAGGDIHTFESKGADLPQYLREATAWLQSATSALIQLRVPVVTAVQGSRPVAAGWVWSAPPTSSWPPSWRSSSPERCEWEWLPTAGRR